MNREQLLGRHRTVFGRVGRQGARHVNAHAADGEQEMRRQTRPNRDCLRGMKLEKGSHDYFSSDFSSAVA